MPSKTINTKNQNTLAHLHAKARKHAVFQDILKSCRHTLFLYVNFKAKTTVMQKKQMMESKSKRTCLSS